ncbi:Rha family transcriptional regulator [Weissella viridescens]|uniref:Rha family transcriptional regulator n=1 Tax=Weissella viridescens TaxID=1629 RepID=UPI003AF30277
MDNLIILENGEPMTTSLKIAEAFGKMHKHVIRDIRKRKAEYEKELESGGPDLGHEILIFEETTYIDERGKEHVMFKLNKDAMIFTVNKWTSPKATQVQLYYIDAFNGMQKQLEKQAQQDFFSVETPEQQTKRITAEAYKMQSENGRMKEFRLAMKQADKLERNDLAEMLLEKEVETFVGVPIKQAVPIEHKPNLSDFYLTATHIAERFGLTPTKVGIIANKTGLRVGVDRIKDEDERWFYTDEAVEKMRTRLGA